MDVRPSSNKQKRQEAKQRRAERRATEQARAAHEARRRQAERENREATARYHDKKQVLRMIVEGQDVPAAWLGPELLAVAQLFDGCRNGPTQQAPLPRPDAAALGRLVLACRGRTGFFEGPESQRFTGALLALSAHGDRWIREPEGWKPRSHNTYRQLHSLARHLVARYDVPTFMNSAWLEGVTAEGLIHQDWFIQVGQGGNIRTADGLPIPLTKKQAHHYLRAPDDFDVMGAFRWAQIIDLGGTERLVRSVLGTRLGTGFANDEFWVTVLRWLVAQPMLDPAQHGPIIDYLHEQRFAPSVPNPDAGLPGRPAWVPPQPNLVMKGRSAETLLRSVARWHRQLGRTAGATLVVWPPSGIAPLRLEEGQDENRRTFTITELLSSHELAEEGRAMGHCVGSYATSCSSGRVSIWSLKVAEAWGRETRLLTLEVWNSTRRVIQARRKFNRMPGDKEMAILARWAESARLTLSNWLGT